MTDIFNDPVYEVKLSYVKCNYCKTGTILINDYGYCPKGCPGYFDVIVECVRTLSSEIIEGILKQREDNIDKGELAIATGDVSKRFVHQRPKPSGIAPTHRP